MSELLTEGQIADIEAELNQKTSGCAGCPVSLRDDQLRNLIRTAREAYRVLSNLSAERQKVAALEAKLAAATRADCVHASGCEPGCLSCVKTQLFHARKHLAEADSENGALREAVQEAVEYDLDGGPCDHRDSDSGCERCELRRMFYKALASSSGKAALE